MPRPLLAFLVVVVGLMVVVSFGAVVTIAVFELEHRLRRRRRRGGDVDLTGVRL
jgi:hypothetical protein